MSAEEKAIGNHPGPFDEASSRTVLGFPSPESESILPRSPENSIKRTPFPVSGASSDTPDIHRAPLKHRTDIVEG
jgi:hypothetical protein